MSGADETANHNCSGFWYVEPDGARTFVSKGCYIEMTDRHTGHWAGCGAGAYDTTTGGAAWNLCFDNGDGSPSQGNAAISLWHAGAPSYHEIFHLNYGVNNPANGLWGSATGDWTWSAWIRYDY